MSEQEEEEKKQFLHELKNAKTKTELFTLARKYIDIFEEVFTIEKFEILLLELNKRNKKKLSNTFSTIGFKRTKELCIQQFRQKCGNGNDDDYVSYETEVGITASAFAFLVIYVLILWAIGLLSHTQELPQESDTLADTLLDESENGEIGQGGRRRRRTRRRSQRRIRRKRRTQSYRRKRV